VSSPYNIVGRADVLRSVSMAVERVAVARTGPGDIETSQCFGAG
jgi:hypothetical protein